MENNRVLVIDDDGSIKKVCSLYLSAEGFVVNTTSEAGRAVKEALSAKPDAIVMDLDMPGIDGLAATRALKSNRKTAGIPVLILSASDDVRVKNRALVTFRADDFLAKPFEPQELVARLTALCRRKRDGDARERVVIELRRQIARLRRQPKLP